jgi:phosphatidylinositol-3-phosphatase
VVVVMEENHAYNEIIGDTADAPYINNTLAAGGASFTQSFAIEHPSEPNYLDLFSGSNQGVTDDSCPHTFSADNEGAQLIAAGYTFAGYSQGLPSTGSTVCTSGAYARKHVPWTNFSNVPTADNKPFSSFPSSANYATLPTVSYVIPDLNNDMHDGTIAQGDTFLKNNLDAYAQWAKTHNSLLIVTWDEDDSSASNQVPTIFYGAGVTPGQYSETIDHYSVLRTIEDMYGLPYAGSASSATPITDVFGTAPAETVSVTNPGAQTGTVGTAVSPLQVSASDSAGKALTYSATGLPAGLSISSSGVISGTPTAAGTSTVTVTASSGTASGSAQFTWVVASSGGTGCKAAQLLGNPGFETGSASPWTATAGVINSDTVSEPAHSGNYDAWLDGYGSPHTDTLAQKVSIPAGCASAAFSFWLHVDTANTSGAAQDTLAVQVLNSAGAVVRTLHTFSNLDAADGYSQVSYDLSSYIGQSVSVKFTGRESGNGQTSFVVDDAALNVK